jgi:hypothetical protein
MDELLFRQLVPSGRNGRDPAAILVALEGHPALRELRRQRDPNAAQVSSVATAALAPRRLDRADAALIMPPLSPYGDHVPRIPETLGVIAKGAVWRHVCGSVVGRGGPRKAMDCPL